MKEKIKCPNCNLLIDNDSEYCPYCGINLNDFLNEKKIKEEKNKETENNQIEKSEHKENNLSSPFFRYDYAGIELPAWKSTLLFMVGLVGLQMTALIFRSIMSTSSFYFTHSVAGSAAVNFASYLVLIGIFLAIASFDIDKIWASIKVSKGWLFGIAFGFILLVVTSAISSIFNLIPNNGVNDNEASIDSISSTFPILSVLVFGFLGPICEEFTYRVGLFSLLRKRKRVPAYLITCVVFGLIHFNFQSTNILNEIINIPSYIVAGLLLCYFYEFKGLGASTIAHIINNVFAIVTQLIISSI